MIAIYVWTIQYNVPITIISEKHLMIKFGNKIKTIIALIITITGIRIKYIAIKNTDTTIWKNLVMMGFFFNAWLFLVSLKQQIESYKLNIMGSFLKTYFTWVFLGFQLFKTLYLGIENKSYDA